MSIAMYQKTRKNTGITPILSLGIAQRQLSACFLPCSCGGSSRLRQGAAQALDPCGNDPTPDPTPPPLTVDKARFVEHLQAAADGDLQTAEGLHRPHRLGDLHRAGLRAGLAGMAVSGAPLGPDEQLPNVRWTVPLRTQ